MTTLRQSPRERVAAPTQQEIITRIVHILAVKPEAWCLYGDFLAAWYAGAGTAFVGHGPDDSDDFLRRLRDAEVIETSEIDTGQLCLRLHPNLLSRYARLMQQRLPLQRRPRDVTDGRSSSHK